MKINPLHDRIVIAEDEADGVSKGGIVLPNKGERPPLGTVVAAGPGIYQDGEFIETPVKEGDRIMYSRARGEEVEVDGERFLIIHSIDLIGIIT